MKRSVLALRAALGSSCLLGLILSSAAVAQQSVNLGLAFNVYAIANPGSPVSGGGVDGYGDAYASDQVSTSVTWGGMVFAFGTPGPTSGVINKVIPLPGGKNATLSFLGAAVEGSQVNQTFVVTYTDGTKAKFTQSMSDWHYPQNYGGESIALTTKYRIKANGSEQIANYSVYGYTIPLDGSKTVASLTPPVSSHILILAIDLSAAGAMPQPASVPLSSVDNTFAIASTGHAVTGGGADGANDAYAADALGTSVTWSSETFNFSGPGMNSAASGKTVQLPPGKDLSLSFLAAGVDGSQKNQTFVVAYTDGTKTTYVQSLSDWHTPQNYLGESVAKTMSYRLTANGTEQNGLYDLYGYTIPLDGSKTVQSLTLPNNSHVVVLAVNLAAAQVVATPMISVASGTYDSPLSVSLTDNTGNATLYYTLDNSAPSSKSMKYTTTLQLTSSATLKAIAVAPGDENSAVASTTYTIVTVPAPAPQFSLTPGTYAGGIYAQPPSLAFMDSNSAASIYYTTDGSPPNQSSNSYSSSFLLHDGETINAIAYVAGLLPSTVSSGTYMLPPFPSDGFGGPEAFLYNAATASNIANGTGNATDVTTAAQIASTCNYYIAVGLITTNNCNLNPDGSFAGGITMATWLAQEYNPAEAPESHATFVNIEDLNFTRDHHAVQYAASDPNGNPFTASGAYVCNFDGPDFYHSNDQAAVNAAVANAQATIANRQKGIIDTNGKPCVMFDYHANGSSYSTPLNGGKPFVRFLAFNSAGGLLPAVDLDGRGTKSIPNACSACHGIPYAAPPAPLQPVGASFIPFDMGNLRFSSVTGTQDASIKALNMIVLNNINDQLPNPTDSDPRAGIGQLIHGWYDLTGQPLGATTQFIYVPENYKNAIFTNPNGNASSDEYGVYSAIYAPFCRSCHVANNVRSTGFPPLKGFSDVAAGVKPDLLTIFGTGDVCAPIPSLVMPNSKASFDHFWTTHVGPTATDPGSDLPVFLQQYFNTDAKGSYGYDVSCSLTLPAPP